MSESAIEIKAVPPEMVAALKKPLPKEAVKPHPTKKYLSTIKVIYMVERLNDVFGLGKWHVRNKVIESRPEDCMVIVKATLTVPEYGIMVENFGGNDNSDRGDAYKGACTDALSNICGYLYVEMDVYKGQEERREPAAQRKTAEAKPANGAARPVVGDLLVKNIDTLTIHVSEVRNAQAKGPKG